MSHGIPDPRKYIKNPGELIEGLKLLRNDAKEWRATEMPENPGFLWKLVHLNPALYRGFVVAIVLVLGSFGLVVTDNQSTAIVGFVSAAAALIQAFWIRGSVTANQKVVVLKPDPVDQPNVVAPGPAVSTDAVAVLNAAGMNGDTGKIAMSVSDLPSTGS
jgi:hypothetical protein